MGAEARSRVPGAIAAAYDGDWSGIVPGIEATTGVAGSLYFGMSLSVMCAEEAPRVGARNWRRETAGTLQGGRPAASLLAACATWDRGTPGPSFGTPVRTDVPMLLLSGELDPATPAAWGAEVAEAASDAAHLVLAGTSHGDFPECAQEIMAAFVEKGTMEGVDTACAANLQPIPLALP